MRVATIDIGTNSILLLIAERAEQAAGGVRALDDRCRIERLGRGVDRSGVLDEGSVAASLAAIREYAAAIREARVERVAVVGTQALREAKNGARFLEPAAEILGVPVEVIGGRREAELAFRAVAGSFPELARGDLVVCDVGGGSTELIVVRDGAIASLASVPIGSVRMTERFLASDPPTREEAAAMIAEIDQALAQALDAALAAHALPAGVPLVGTAGTVTTLAAVAIALDPYDPDQVHGMRLPRGEVERQLARYLELAAGDRRHLPGLDSRRADVIAAGCAIVARVMARVDARELVVSDRGVRWGLAYELFDAAARG